MEIEFTAEQQRQLAQAANGPIRVRDPQTRTEYILVHSEEYEQMLEIIEDDLEQRALRRAGAKALARRLADDA